MTTGRHAFIVAIVTSGGLGLSACSPQGPSQAELTAANEETRATVRTVADETVAAFEELNPDLTFTLEPAFALGAEWWLDCSSTPAPDTDNPTAVQWLADRTLQVEPRQDTGQLLPPVIQTLTTAGWTLVEDARSGEGVVKLGRDGYQIVLGAQALSGDDPARVAMNVYSPCIDAPEDFPPETS